MLFKFALFVNPMRNSLNMLYFIVIMLWLHDFRLLSNSSLIGFRIMVLSSGRVISLHHQILPSKISEDVKDWIITTWWAIWKVRNNLIFRKKKVFLPKTQILLIFWSLFAETSNRKHKQVIESSDRPFLID